MRRLLPQPRNIHYSAVVDFDWTCPNCGLGNHSQRPADIAYLRGKCSSCHHVHELDYHRPSVAESALLTAAIELDRAVRSQPNTPKGARPYRVSEQPVHHDPQGPRVCTTYTPQPGIPRKSALRPRRQHAGATQK